MQADVSLSDYYSKLIQVQMAARVTRTLDSELYHHLNNSAATLGFYARRSGMNDEAQANLITTALEIQKYISVPVGDIMKAVTDDVERLNVGALLVDMVLDEKPCDQGIYDGLCAFHSRLNDYAETLRLIRMDAEIDMLDRSGLTQGPIDMDAPHGPITIGDYFHKLARVQLAQKTANAQRTEITEHMTLGAVAIQNRIREMDDEVGTMMKYFKRKETTLVMDANTQVLSIMAPLSVEAQNLEIASTRLVTLVREPQKMTEAHYENLCRFHDHLDTASCKLRAIRKETEVDMLRKSGLVQPVFKV